MKLTYITAASIPSRWAHSVQAMKMAQAFQEVGHDVELVTACSFKDWVNHMSAGVWEHYGISTTFSITRLPLSRLVEKEKRHNSGWFSYGYFAALWAKQRRTDLVYTRRFLAPYWSARMGIPTIAETHAAPDENYQKQKLYEAARMDSFKVLVTISDLLAEQYIQAGVPEGKVIVEQDGVDLSAFSSINKEEIEKTRATLLNGRRAVALYAGHLYDYKGIPLILKVAEKLSDVSFVLVGGWDEDVDRVRKRAEDLGLKNLILTGFVSNNNVPVYLKAADVLLLPYSGTHHQAATTSPLKLFEYMAAERPIVASSIGNVANVLKDGHNGLLLKPDDSEALARGIRRLLHSKDLGTELALQARFDVEKYAWTERVKRIINFACSR